MEIPATREGITAENPLNTTLNSVRIFPPQSTILLLIEETKLGADLSPKIMIHSFSKTSEHVHSENKKIRIQSKFIPVCAKVEPVF